MTALHTELTLRNFSSYAALAFTIGLVTVGFGAIDLLMVGVLGFTHVAAVGQGGLIATCILAAFIGFVDVFATRLAAAEGSGDRRARQIGLSLGFLCAVLLCAAAAIVAGMLIHPALVLMQQVDALIDPINAYVVHRLYGVAPSLIYMAANEALKISGLRTRAFHILLFGFAANAGLNALFLYTPAAALFDSPEAAVAVATVLVNIAMGAIAALVWIRHVKAPPSEERVGIWKLARLNLGFLFRTAPGISARILNDYASSVIPILFIGTMNTATVAAAAVATKIYTLFCRVPQAAFAASFVYYSYGLEAREGKPDSEDSRRVIRTLLRYAAWPTAIAMVATLAASPWLVRLFGGGIDMPLARSLLLAYLLFVPLYFFEHFYGELLTAHARAGLLFGASTAATYPPHDPDRLHLGFPGGFCLFRYPRQRCRRGVARFRLLVTVPPACTGNRERSQCMTVSWHSGTWSDQRRKERRA